MSIYTSGSFSSESAHRGLDIPLSILAEYHFRTDRWTDRDGPLDRSVRNFQVDELRMGKNCCFRNESIKMQIFPRANFNSNLRYFKMLFSSRAQDCKGQIFPGTTSPLWHCDLKPLLHEPVSTWLYNECRRFFRIAVIAQENQTNNVDEMRCLAVIFSMASSAQLNSWTIK